MAWVRSTEAWTIPSRFATQATINASKDAELLELAADGGIAFLFIGIESINPETLANINKRHNLNKDLIAEAQRIMSYGIALRGNTIVGFDEDDTSTFERLFEFHQTACFPVPAITILQAPHGTPLWRKMVEKGQVVVEAGAFERGRYSDQYDGYHFNTIPKSMSRVELMEGYADLYTRLFEWPNIHKRNEGWLRLLKRPPYIPEERYSDEDVRKFMGGLESRSLLDDDGRRVIRELTEVCREVAPSLWRRLKIILTMQAHIQQSLRERVVPSLRHQIRHERSGVFKPVAKSFRAPVPRAFREHFRELLAPVYKHIQANLDDEDRLHEAITRVFVDFLVRWGDEFEEPAAHHATFLTELCNRTCAEMNRVPPEEFVPVEPVRTPAVSRGLSQAREDILRNLDIELGFEPHGEPRSHHVGAG